MKRLSLFLALAFCVELAHAQDIPLEVKGPGVRVVTVVESLPFTINAPAGAGLYDWKIPAGVTATGEDEDTLTVQTAPKGSIAFRVRLTYGETDGKKVTFKRQWGTITVQVGDKPGPGPAPDPDPVPDEKAPIPHPGFRVLMIYESKDNLALIQQIAPLIAILRDLFKK